MTASSLLLDTHVFIWWMDDDPKLKPRAAEWIRRAGTVHVSIASAWEIAIKSAAGRLSFPIRFRRQLEETGFEALNIGLNHVERIAELPKHHGDPFDRMLVAQAMVEGLTLVTADRKLDAYGVPILWN